MTLASIRQCIQNIDYAWNKPQTYLVLVPVLSLVIQKIQMKAILPLPLLELETDLGKFDATSRKFSKICKAHCIGSGIQILALCVATVVSPHPVFIGIALVASYETLDTLIKTFKNPITTFEFGHNGASAIKIKMINPLTYLK